MTELPFIYYPRVPKFNGIYISKEGNHIISKILISAVKIMFPFLFPCFK